ncbi:MAG: homoserine dehydrogenase [Eubacteriaceae bacterium]|nr:homoserine dehydrogenase [Eubacteriaceae bacterium]MDD4508032.1 homoserine dehydrogenase [Eubacteriaceae bacterium]
MNIALLGFGTIGTGVYELINLNKGRFADNLEEPVVITKILDKDPNKKVDPSDHICQIVTDPELIMKDPDITIVIALLGGMDFEYKMIKAALENGKHVVTASKAVISEYFEELVTLAQKNNVILRYEAAVGGGIPIIASLKEELKINRINEIKGILNGTTNFILSKMTENAADFGDTLKLAQSIGFAEADPTADIEGYDVSRKLSILSTLAYGGVVRDEDVKKRGLADIRAIDIEMAGDMGYNVKYLGHSKLIDKDKVYTTVEPVLFPKESMMSNVNSEFNIISIAGDIIGELQFYGKGAGKDATANAVVGDALYIINCMKEGTYPSYLPMDKPLQKLGNSVFEGRYYLRANLKKEEDLEFIMKIMDQVNGRSHIIISDKTIFFNTGEVHADSFDDMVTEIKKKVPDLFYARIYE